MARFRWWAAMAATLVACGPGDGTGDGDVEKAEFDCELGSVNIDGVFEPYSEQNRAELYFGFQGFLFLEAQVRVQQTLSTCQVTASLMVEDEDPMGGAQPAVAFQHQEDGSMLSEDIVVFLPSSSASAWAGRTGTLSVRVEDASNRCVTSAEVLLVDDDPCIHSGDEPICPDEDTGAR